jgi:hypothetical protein
MRQRHRRVPDAGSMADPAPSSAWVGTPTRKHFPRFALTVDLANAFEWLNALERRVAQLEELTRTLTAVRSDLASIAEGTDPALAQRLADLGSTVENHGLLLAQLLDQRT